MFIYLDESGDLGFDFNSKNPSRYFVITLLVCEDRQSVQMVKKAIERTLKNKIRSKNKHRKIDELKGTSTNIAVKSYFFRQAVKTNMWKLYSIVLDKKAALTKLPKPINKHRLYNVLSNHLLKQVNFLQASTVNLYIDRCKDRDGINEFDTLLQASLEVMLPLSVPSKISHIYSHYDYGIQAVDLFCWGIFRKYELSDETWYAIFSVGDKDGPYRSVTPIG